MKTYICALMALFVTGFAVPAAAIGDIVTTVDSTVDASRETAQDAECTVEGDNSSACNETDQCHGDNTCNGGDACNNSTNGVTIGDNNCQGGDGGPKTPPAETPWPSG
jgi:hypothetical protein